MDEPPISNHPWHWQDLDLGSSSVVVRCLGLGCLSLITCCWLFQMLGSVTVGPVAIEPTVINQQR
ncbi:hypothetical protein [Synechococcus elongatus]|uniref:hypothetical protein n=1 Tax=Synechococcus elongatus TaxID=32046 RepID=UPI0030D291BE